MQYQREKCILVWLVDGENEFTGIVYAKNPVTGKAGPVCQHGWSQTNVSNKKITLITLFSFASLASARVEKKT